MITIEHGRFEEWEPWVANSLKRQCYTEGAMRDEVRMRPDTPTWVAFDGNKVVAWALASQDNFDQEWALMFYTSMKYRRRGIGRRLYKAAMKWHRHLPSGARYPTHVFPDWENHGFFTRIGRNYDVRQTPWRD